MKKFFLCLCALFVVMLPSCSDANEDVLPDDESDNEFLDLSKDFPDPVFRDYVLQYFDLNHDGKISIGEANKVEYISVSSLKVTSLEGIQFFPALKYLNCSASGYAWGQVHGNLTSLDVSHNTALEVLDCCRQQLRVLDLSHNTALLGLDCSDNYLTKLDVSMTKLDKYGSERDMLMCNMSTLRTLILKRGWKIKYSINDKTKIEFVD